VFPEPVAFERLDLTRSSMELEPRMKDFSNAAFSPDQIAMMHEALERAVATLPHPVSSLRVQTIAESILRSAQQGEHDVRTLQAMALVEMQLRCDEIA
jgi:hypothetical protein